VQDCWSEGALRSKAECRQRVLRGGAWNFTAEFARSDARSYSAVSLRFDNYGFRVAHRLK
jgi:formylglycine-generating enzyme required for sulfatase activity